MFPRRDALEAPVPRREYAAVTGRARVDARTKRLVKRLAVGDIAVINHEDVDRVAAEALIEARPKAVLNANFSITTRYPSMGALLLVQAGIVLIDDLGADVMKINEGTNVRIENDAVLVDGQVVASGRRRSVADIESVQRQARDGLSVALSAFAENTLEYIRTESFLLFDPPDAPKLDVNMKRRHVMVVVRGHDYREDLSHLRGYVRDMSPVVIAVDGGADACLQEGLKPDVILGDFDSVSDDALKCGAQLVVHAYVDGDAPGAQRLDELGLKYVTYEAPGMSEDVAMLLAYDEGAELIVAVGTHASMVEFLDKGRAGMASTFLTRLKVGPVLVDAKGVSRLYRGVLRKSDLMILVGSACIAFLVMGAVSAPFRTFLDGILFLIGQFFSDLWRTLTPW